MRLSPEERELLVEELRQDLEDDDLEGSKRQRLEGSPRFRRTGTNSQEDVDVRTNSQEDVDVRTNSQEDMYDRTNSQEDVDGRMNPQEDVDVRTNSEEDGDAGTNSQEDIMVGPSLSEFNLSMLISQTPLDVEGILALRTTCRAAYTVIDDCQSWTTRLDKDFPPRRGETMDLLSVYANSHMRYVLFLHLQKCERQWRKHPGSLWMSWTWFCSRIVRRVSPEMYDVANKRAVAGGNHDVGTRSSPRVARLPDPSINVPLELHTSISKSLGKLCDMDWLLVYEQLGEELRVRAKIICMRLDVPIIDDDFDIDEALLYLPLWHCGTSCRRVPPVLSGVRDFRKAEAFIESILTAYYDFEDVGKMLQETSGALDFCIQEDREGRHRSHIVHIRELVRIAFQCGVLMDCLRVKKTFVWAVYCTIHRAARGANYELLHEVADMVTRIAPSDDRGPPAWRRDSTWFAECILTPAKLAQRRFSLD